MLSEVSEEPAANRIAPVPLDLRTGCDVPALGGLSPTQRTAAAHPGPRLLVRGAAGTGKTRTLQARFLRLAEEGVAPERIGVLVPTHARATAGRAHLETQLRRPYEELVVLTPGDLSLRLLRSEAPVGAGWTRALLGPGDRLALLVERIDELSLRHHDLGGRPISVLGSFVRRIDRLKGERISAERAAEWAAGLPDDDPVADREREFAEVYRVHERLLARAGARDDGDLMLEALALALAGHARPGLDHLLVDDAQELDAVSAALVLALPIPQLALAGDPDGGLRRFRGAGAERLAGFAAAGADVVELDPTGFRCPPGVRRAAAAVLGRDPGSSSPADPPAAVELWRCPDERSQAQSVAVEIERLIARDGVPPGQIAVIVPETTLAGPPIAVALEERAIAHRLIAETAFFQRAEIRDVLAWLRLLADPTDAAAVVRALARPPIALPSVDIARCTQIARRRKLDMVAALAAALDSPLLPPEARDRIRTFLRIYRGSIPQLDSSRPDLYVYRLIERLGLRRQQLFTAQADVVERLRALAALGELAAAHVARDPQATPREFARSVAAVAELGLGREEEPELTGAAPGAVQVLAAAAAGGLEVDHVFVCGFHAGATARAPEPIPEALLGESLPPDDLDTRRRLLRQELYVACSRARRRLVLSYPRAEDRTPSGAGAGEPRAPAPALEAVRAALGADWQDREAELFGPAEALHSTYRMLRDELLAGTTRAAGRLGELRFDTDLDVSHAVVRYLELLKLAALIARGENGGGETPPSVAEALPDINARILQAVTAEEREIFETSELDDYLLDAERGARARARAVRARDEPSLEAFLPLRGDGVVLSASDIDTYRSCPLKYKFARVLRIPQEPTVHQRFGILVHQVLERYHASPPSPGAEAGRPTPSLPELLGLLDAGWRRGGFGDSEEERQLRGKASAALTRYHERFRTQAAEPVWFERQFTFPLGRHLLRGRVDRVDRLPGGEYELIDYKTGRPKSAAQLTDDVQLSLYAVGARESWQLEASRQAYYYLLDDQKVAVPGESQARGERVREIATEVAEGIRSQGFEPTPSFAACSLCDYRLVCPAAER
jgi:DNA helicase-2/ATP-dependent DNA helicase PcrA